MDEPELDPGSLVLAQGFHGAWFPARVVQAHSTSVLVALQSDVEEHSEWVGLHSGRCSPGTPNPAPLPLLQPLSLGPRIAAGSPSSSAACRRIQCFVPAAS